jgi:probable rRNA maturation factor
MITIKNAQRKFEINIKKIEQDITKILNFLNYKDFDIGILLTNNKNIQKVNKKYRNKNKPTDILSFPYHTDLQAGKRIKVREEEDKNLGDLILSLEHIEKEAEKLKIPVEQHIQRLLVHGICHLLGYDHIKDKDWRKMRAKEGWLLKKLANC